MDQPFHDLDVFKEKIARNVASISSQDKLAALLQADKDAEAVLMSLLKGHMLDLYEALSWQYASKEDVESKRRRLLAGCEDHIKSLKKEWLPHLAREHGISTEFCKACKDPEAHTVDDYDRLADLDFALMVWRQNLKRSASLASTGQEKQEMVRAAYVKAEHLVKRCLDNSHRLWNKLAQWSQISAPRQSAYSMARSPKRSMSLIDAPLGGESIITIYERAMAQVWLKLEAIAQQHGVTDALQALVRIERASSHPLNFGQVAVALDQVRPAQPAGQSPSPAQDAALEAEKMAPLTPPALAQSAPVSTLTSKFQDAAATAAAEE